MKLTKTAIQLINNSQSRMRIALALKVTETWITRTLKNNPTDNILTKATAIKAIKEETGLTESEILTEEELEQAG